MGEDEVFFIPHLSNQESDGEFLQRAAVALAAVAEVLKESGIHVEEEITSLQLVYGQLSFYAANNLLQEMGK